MITRAEILMGRDVQYPLTAELEDNLSKLLDCLNQLREVYGQPMFVSSGYRPGPYNAAAHGAVHSNHMTCLACDFKDVSGEIDAWCLRNLHELEAAGLYLEDPRNTPGWCHVQCVPPKSGHRVFIP